MELDKASYHQWLLENNGKISFYDLEDQGKKDKFLRVDVEIETQSGQETIFWEYRFCGWESKSQQNLENIIFDCANRVFWFWKRLGKA